MNKIYSKVYGWLFVGLLLTFATGAFFSNYENAIINLMSWSRLYSSVASGVWTGYLFISSYS